jgi:cell division protein FtsL
MNMYSSVPKMSKVLKIKLFKSNKIVLKLLDGIVEYSIGIVLISYKLDKKQILENFV